jgi:apolipoprotein N-acyltransferase
MEWLRAHVISGFGMAMLPHAMFRQPLLIQTADLIGGYGTSAILVFISAAAVRATRSYGMKRITFASVGLGLLGMALGYGAWRLSEKSLSSAAPLPIGLIQGSRDVRFELNPAEARREWLAQFREYRDLTVRARQTWPDLQLIIWPESALPVVDIIPQSDEQSLSNEHRANLAESRDAVTSSFLIGLGTIPMQGDASPRAPFVDTLPLLAGGQGFDQVRNRQFNSAILFGDVRRVRTVGRLVSNRLSLYANSRRPRVGFGTRQF